jgi:hypothetical protein
LDIAHSPSRRRLSKEFVARGRHSHAGFGRQGNHFNVASAARMRSMIIDLETMGHQVVGLGQTGLEA